MFQAIKVQFEPM